MAVINLIDLGAHPTWGAPFQTKKGQNARLKTQTVQIRGGKEFYWMEGAEFPDRTETVWVTGATPAATLVLVNQLLELVGNPDLNKPCYIQWASGGGFTVSDPQDGWYFIIEAEPDTEFSWTTYLPVKLMVRKASSGSPRYTSVWNSGITLPTTYTGTSQNWYSLPVNSSSLVTTAFTRSGVEGAIPSILNPVLNPSPFLPPTSVTDVFRGGLHVYDAMAPISTNGVPVTLIRDDQETPSSGVWSVHQDPFNNLNAIGPSSGLSLAAHVITSASGGTSYGIFGHPDWQDLTYQVRFQFSTNSVPSVVPRWIDANNNVFARADGTNLILFKQVGAGNFTNLANSATVALTNGTFYWFKVTISGTNITVQVFTDSGGAITATQVGGNAGPAPVTDAILSKGQVGIGNGIFGSASATCAFGGNFTSVCLVTQPTTSQVSGFGTAGQTGAGTDVCSYCYDATISHSGTRSISIYMPTTNAWGFYQYGWVPQASTVFTASMWCKGPAGAISQLGALTAFGGSPSIGFFTSPAFTYTGNWQQISFTFTTGSPAPPVTNLRVEPMDGSGNAPAGIYYFDDVLMVLASTPGSLPVMTNANWVEVFGIDHRFVGDMVITNGLQLLVFSVGVANQVATCYLWDTSLSVPAWLQYAVFAHSDTNSVPTSTLRSATLLRLSTEEVSVQTVNNSNANVAQITVRLQRGSPTVRVDLRPMTYSNTDSYSLMLMTPANVKGAWTSTGFSDPIISGTGWTGSASSDYGYDGGFINSTTYPFIAGWLYQNVPAFQGLVNNTPNDLALGDNIGPAINATRSYGFYAIPFPAVNLQAEAESGTLSNGVVSVADAAASGGNTAKVPSGTTGQLPAPNPLPTVTDGGAAAGTLNAGGYDVVQTWTDASGETTSSGDNTSTQTPTLVQSGVVLTTSGLTTITPTFAAGTTAGNCLVAVIATSTGAVNSGPVGWNKITSITRSTLSFEIWAYLNNAGGVTTVQFNTSFTQTNAEAQLSEWSKVALVTATDTSGTNTAGGAPTTLSLTTSGNVSQANDVAIAAWSLDKIPHATVSFTTPAGFIRLADNGSVDQSSHLDAEYKINPSSGSTLGVTMTCSAGGACFGAIVCLKAAPVNTVFLTANGDKIHIAAITGAPTGATNGKFYLPAAPAAMNNGLAATQAVSGGTIAAFDITANPGNTAQPPTTNTTTGTPGVDLFGTAWVPPPGSYALWYRLKVTSAAGANQEMRIGLWDSTLGAYNNSLLLRPNQVTTSYVWYLAAFPCNPASGHSMQFRLTNNTLTGTDWFIDEAALVPITSSTSYSFPQDLWQQFMFDRVTEIIQD